MFQALPTVYSPREDSELLANAALAHAFGNVLDMGCGTGIAGISAAQRGDVESVTFADLNPAALESTKANCKTHEVLGKSEFIKTDLFSSLAGRKFETILFNPPYLPTSEEEKLSDAENLAYDGGNDGRETVDRFLELFDTHLNAGGLLLLIQSSRNDPEKTGQILSAKGFAARTLGGESFFFERIESIAASKNFDLIA